MDVAEKCQEFVAQITSENKFYEMRRLIFVQQLSENPSTHLFQAVKYLTE